MQHKGIIMSFYLLSVLESVVLRFVRVNHYLVQMVLPVNLAILLLNIMGRDVPVKNLVTLRDMLVLASL